MTTKLTYVCYDYTGGIRDGEYGVFLKINDEYLEDKYGRMEFSNSGDAFYYYVTSVLNLDIEEDFEEYDE